MFENCSPFFKVGRAHNRIPSYGLKWIERLHRHLTQRSLPFEIVHCPRLSPFFSPPHPTSALHRYVTTTCSLPSSPILFTRHDRLLCLCMFFVLTTAPCCGHCLPPLRVTLVLAAAHCRFGHDIAHPNPFPC